MREGQHSRTALLVAGGIVFAQRDPALQAATLPAAAELSRALLATSPQGRRLLSWADSPIRRALLRAVERLTIPGIIGHWTCRKHWIDQAWHAALAEGFDTLLVAGCGLDTLTLRTAQQTPRVRTIEVDHPATSALRRAALSTLGMTSPSLIPHDLTTSDLSTALRNALRPDASVVLVLEGVLMYISPQRVESLLREIATLPAKRLRLIFTFMEATQGRSPAFQPRSPFIDAYLALVGEPFLSGLDPSTLPQFLAALGFQLQTYTATPGHDLVTTKLPTGESAAIADRTNENAA